MMKIDIRSSIKNNFQDSEIDDMKQSISSAISEGKEITLPGLGVFFEILWNHSKENEQTFILNTIRDALKKDS